MFSGCILVRGSCSDDKVPAYYRSECEKHLELMPLKILVLNVIGFE